MTGKSMNDPCPECGGLEFNHFQYLAGITDHVILLS